MCRYCTLNIYRYQETGEIFYAIKIGICKSLLYQYVDHENGWNVLNVEIPYELEFKSIAFPLSSSFCGSTNKRFRSANFKPLTDNNCQKFKN